MYTWNIRYRETKRGAWRRYELSDLIAESRGERKASQFRVDYTFCSQKGEG